MFRAQQDQFVDEDEEEVCPLCVEEFDLSDKNFRPCPCGYQICQFCYNNIKTTMNGLCPACRRPYDEKSIEFKNITAEELAMHKAEIAQKAKKNAAIRQKEMQKREADSLSRKHLAGLRVVQKNLVYVTGLTPTIRDDRLHETLRGSDYFGQYGNIIKIVVSKAKDNQQSVGVYVTFARKEDAASCIAAVDGSKNGERTLRAQYGTTKYCSAYLRNEQCNNRNCMFLHEPGEENDSFTRQDLSSMNVISTQQPAQSLAPHSAANPLQPQPPPQRAPHNIAAAQTMDRQDSDDGPVSPTHSNGDGPALPATAHWGSKTAQGRRASRSTNVSNSSPMTSNAVPDIQSESTKVEAEPALKKKGKDKDGPQKSAQPSTSSTQSPSPPSSPTNRTQRVRIPHLDGLLKSLSNQTFEYVFSATTLSPEELEIVKNYPQMIDPNGGAKRRAKIEKEKELERQRLESEAELQPASVPEPEDNPEGGSLQLGGEPEERHDTGLGRSQHSAIAPPGSHNLGTGLGFGQNSSLTEDFSNLGVNGRSLTAQQQQQLLLFKSGAPQSAGLLSAFQGNHGQQHTQQAGATPGHARHTSRFSFANDSNSASAAVQPVANVKLMNQQSSMMPKATNHFNQLSQHQPLGNQFYTSGVQGPPPGLKATGTPPVSGGGMFGQGHGFATGGLGYGANAMGRSANDAMYQELLRNRGGDTGARVPDAGKHEQEFAPSEQASLSVDALVNDFDIDTDSHMGLPPSRGHILQQPRRATPTIPPGFSAPATPRLPSETPLRPLSRTAIAAGITPAVPLLRTATPVKSKIIERHSDLLKDHPAPDTSDLSTPPVTVGSKDLESHKNPSQQSVVPNPRQSEILEEMKTKDEARQVQKENTSSAIRPAGSNLTGIKSPSKSDLKTKRAASDFVSTNKSTMTTSADYSPQKAAKAAPRTVSSPSKRQPPGKLDIAAATKLSEKDLVDAATMAVSNMPDIQMKNARAVSLAPTISHPSSPAVPSTGSPIKRSAPRTIRVLPTPKSENPPPLSASSAASMPPLPSVVKLRSRQASVTSLNQPGTPASEFISDNASIASTSISRANSPPPGTVVGSAPIRQKTKTQAKRERQERAKQIADEKNMVMEDFVKSSDPEPVQAPIVGRKKKAKKSAAVSSNATAASTPAISLPASPKTATHNKAEEERDASESSSSAPAPAAIPSASATKKASPTKSTSPTKSSQPLPPSPDPPKSSKFTQSSQSQPTAASILADLQRTGDLLASTLEFFKPLSASISHLTRTGTPATSPSVDPTSIPSHPDLRIHFSEADLDALAKKLPVHLGGEDGKTSTRTLITPQGKFLWGLSKELEERVLELEKRVEEIKGIARWRPQGQKSYQHPQLHNATGRVGKGDYKTDVLPAIATALKEAGAKLGKQAQTQSATSSTGTKYATHAKDNAAFDDALAYLNQWVLPSDSPQSGTLHTQMPRSEAASVGGPAPSLAPSSLKNNADFAAAAAKIVAAGGGDAHRTANLAAAAKLVAAGGGDVNMIPIPDLENLGVFAAEVLGGYVVQGLEALVGVDGTGGVFGGTAYGGTGGVSRTYGAGEGAGGRGGAGMGGSAGSVLSLEEAEQAMIQSRKEAEQLEKKVNALVKRNRKILSGAVGGR